MRPFTHLDYETYRAHHHEHDFLERLCLDFEMALGQGDAETDSDLNDVLYLSSSALHAREIVARIETYRRAVVDHIY